MKHQFLRFPQGKNKAVTFSYDDGCRDDIRLIEIMNRYGIKGTFNICNANIAARADEWTMTQEEIKVNILDAGHEIAVHGNEHRAPGKLRPIEGIKEVLNCRLGLEEKFGVFVRGMAYPNSGIREIFSYTDYETIRVYLQNMDIVYARSLKQDNSQFALPTDFYQWIPTAHHNNPELFSYIEKFHAPLPKYYPARNSRLFYLWGHSFEFADQNNWALAEKICAALGQREDTWYATNMEIYEYCHAYDQLIYTADGNKCFNPTLVDLWVEVDETVYRIPSGKTISFK